HAEARPQAGPLLARPAQHVQGSRTAVHEVPGQPEPVARGVEGEPAQQPAQRAVAALDVPDRVGGARPAASPHAPIFSSTPDPIVLLDRTEEGEVVLVAARSAGAE